MRAHVSRQKLMAAAVLTASVALTAACGGTKPTTPGVGPSSTPAAQLSLAAGTLLIADGTTTVQVGEKKVVFPTSVTDPSWSPDGSRIVFVNGDGDICTAHPDGSGLIVLTETDTKVKRSQPTWDNAQIVFAEAGADGKSQLMVANANGTVNPYTQHRQWLWHDSQSKGDSSPTSDGHFLYYEHKGSKGSEVWIFDETARDPESVFGWAGAKPAAGPDSQIAFVAANGQISVKSGPAGKVKQVTFGADSPSHIAWSPDGKTLTFQTATGLASVPTAVAAGVTDNPATQVATGKATATYLPGAKGKVSRLTGADQTALSIAVSQAQWPTQEHPAGGQGWGYQTEATLFNDPKKLLLEGGRGIGPVLFNDAKALDPRVSAELRRAFGTVIADYQVPTVHLLGDFSPAVEQAVKALGFQVDRTTAGRRYNQLPELSGVPFTDLVIADASDPVSVAVAQGSGSYLYLTTGPVSSAGRSYLERLSAKYKLTIVGKAAQAAVGQVKNSTVLDGDPAEAMAAVGRLIYHDVVLVRSSDSAGLLLATITMRPVFVVGDEIGPKMTAWLDANSTGIDQVLVIDSGNAAPAGVSDRVGALISGPVGFDRVANPTAVLE